MDGGSLSVLKKFIIENNIVGTSAGVCIALAVKDAIQSLVGDIIIPVILIATKNLHLDILKKYLPSKGHTTLNLESFIKQMITFVIVIISSFIFVKLSFEYLLHIELPEKKVNNSQKVTDTLSTRSDK